MQHVFVIAGTGVPKSIHRDTNYQIFLNAAFNNIYDTVTLLRIKKPIIILSGGRTDCWPPYRRTEAGEMAKVIRKLMRRPMLKSVTRSWRLVLEPRAISSLENHLEVQGLLRRYGRIDVTWLCEWTRRQRHLAIGRQVFGRRFRVVGIDYDVSANRYLTPRELQRKGAFNLRFARWAMGSKANLSSHHDYYHRRLVFLRGFPPQRHAQAIKAWSQRATQELPSSFPHR